MLHYTKTTVFNVDVQTIVNTVNCVGVMGAGLALEFKLRFPEMYEDYRMKCQQKKLQVGKPYVYRDYSSPWIMNFPTKNNWKYPSKIEWIEQGLQYFLEKYKDGRIVSIAFPKLGCDKGGLDWNDVKLVMEKYLEPLDIDVYICLDQDTQAMGIEKQMIDYINNTNNRSWISDLGIKDNIASKILENVPLRRFREILRIQGVGKQTYFDLFNYSYSQAISVENDSSKSNQINVQLNLENFNNDRNEAIETREEIKQIKNENKPEIHNNLHSLEHFDLFEKTWPFLEEKLQSEQKLKDLADFFKVREIQIKDWLQKAMDMGKVKKLTKPVRYVVSSDEKDKLPLLEYMNSNGQ